MCVYVYVVSVCMRVCVLNLKRYLCIVCVEECVRAYMFICRIHLYVSMRVCLCVCVSMCVWVGVQVCGWVGGCVCVCAKMMSGGQQITPLTENESLSFSCSLSLARACTHTHTHTHTNTHRHT